MLYNYTIRLSNEAVEQAKSIAKKDHIPVRTLMQSAILKMIDERIGVCDD